MRPFILLILMLVATQAAASDQKKKPVEDVGTIMVAFGAHLDAYPLAEAEDLYKFLHQAVFGPGHAINDQQAAADWMARELEELGPRVDGESSCEALGGEIPLVRVNLRPFLEGGGDPELLVDAFVTSANRERGSGRRMKTVLSLAASYVECAGRGELAPDLVKLAAQTAEAAYPAIHHSDAYVEAYLPAYRVIEERLAAKHGWCED